MEITSVCTVLFFVCLLYIFHSCITLLCKYPVFVAAVVCEPLYIASVCLWPQARLDLKHFELLAVPTTLVKQTK